MDTLAAIGRWLSKQHVVTLVRLPVKTSCGARMPFTSMTRIPWPLSAQRGAHPPWPDDRTEGEGGRHG